MHLRYVVITAVTGALDRREDGATCTALLTPCPAAIIALDHFLFNSAGHSAAARTADTMGACTSRDANRSPRRLNNWKVDEDTPTFTDGTAATPTGALDDQAAVEQESELALNCVAYSSFLGAECLTGWEDGSIQRLGWRSQVAEPVNVWKPHARAVNRIVIGDKLQMIYSCSRDTTVAITPITDKPASETATVLRGHQLNVSTVAVDDAEQMLCSGGRDTQTIFWDLTTSHITTKNTTPQNVVTCSTWLPREPLVAQGSEDLSVKLWDPRTPLRVPAQTLRGFVYFPLSIAAYGGGNENDSTYLLTSSKGFNGVGCEARVWDRRTGKQIVEFQGHQQDATVCCVLPTAADNSIEVEAAALPMLPVTASKDGTVKVWDTKTRTPLAEAHAEGIVKSVEAVGSLMANRGDLLAECAQHLRSSSFEYEVLLGASVNAVWQALGRHVTRQLNQRKGVSLQQLGRFGFYKAQTSMLPAAPVFLVADRFASTYGVVWRHRSPPAPLTATAEVNMAALGNDAGLGSDQARRALNAILTFIGKKLQDGESAGRLLLAGVGSFTLDGKALSFTFEPSLLRAITQSDQIDIPPPSAIFRKSSTGGTIDSLRKKAFQLDTRKRHGNRENSTLQRSLSLDGALQPPSKSNHQLQVLGDFAASHPKDVDRHKMDVRNHHNDNRKDKERKRHRHKHRQELQDSTDNNNVEAVPLNGRQILPRFLIPEPRVPPEVLKARPNHDQVMQAAFQREVANIEQAKRADDQFNDTLATRQRVVQIRDLQKRAEQAVARRELNSFLNNQIEEKRSRSRQKSASATTDRCDYREIKILPLEHEVSDEAKRAEKQKLNQRLNEQVAAKAALKKDRRTLDQAESAYFVSKLKMQEDIDRQELAERKRSEKEALLAGWSQQKAVRAQKKTLKVHLRSSPSCPNVTTVAIHGSSSNSSKTSTASTNVQITDASTCKSSVVKAVTSSGVKTLDLRHKDIAAVESLPSVDTVGVIFPDSLTELTLIATAHSAAAVSTSTASVVTPEEARALQTTAQNPATQVVSVLEEFEVRQSDADMFENLTLWDVSTTSTLSCSDSNANPRYVQDTMLCVLSDSEFAAKYESVVIAASMSGSMWGTDTTSSQEVERLALKETLDQRRSWFLIGAAALLSAFTVLLFVNAFCMCLRRKVQGTSKAQNNQPAMIKTASGRSNSFWHDNASMEPDDEVRHLLSSDPPTNTDENSSQPEPELESEKSPTKLKLADPLAHLQQELQRSEIDGTRIKRRELLSTAHGQHEAMGESSGERSSPFAYFKADYHGKTVVLKTLSIAGHLKHKTKTQDDGELVELWAFAEEIRLSSTLSHPQLIAFYGFIRMTRVAEHSNSEGAALVMEYMNKGDLNTFIQAHKRSLQQPERGDRQQCSTTPEIIAQDKHAGWHDEENDESGDDGYEVDILRAGNEVAITNNPARWNWRSSSAVYKSKLAIAIEVAQAVQYLHSFSQPLFHGNLSSRKVFLDKNWNVKLGDMTCCSALRRWSSSHKQNDMSSAPSTTGSSPARYSGRSNCSSQTGGEEIHMDMTVWTAPEVLDGRQYTQKADIYSFGVLLAQLATYECTSAEHSVMDDTDVPMLNNNQREHSSADGEAPTPIRLLMFRCQAFQPEVRPTADELLEELHQIEHDLMDKPSA
ncbi:unnamed protein product [Phytophthora lilii]|uniref:Unnamed protein product n=1 Tax=Phytophthora lilii TaxID=2077276 RepID=A0A9W6TG52_9STRA|nr:unnamed protein product [Phytophthora lilii]